MEKFREAVSETCRSLIGNKCIREAKKLHVSKKGTGTGSTDVICDQQSLSVQTRPQFCRFAARRSTEVQYILAGSDREAGSGCHRAWLLEIIEPRLIKRAVGRTDIFRIKITVRNPRDRCHRERNKFFKFFAADLGGVDTKPVSSGYFVAFYKRIIFFSEHFFHAGEKDRMKKFCDILF